MRPMPKKKFGRKSHFATLLGYKGKTKVFLMGPQNTKRCRIETFEEGGGGYKKLVLNEKIMISDS